AVTLQKPFTPEKLVAALSTATGKLLNMLPASPEQMGLSLVQPVVLGPLPPAAAASRDERRVLIVDDSKPARLHVRGVLTDLGMSHFGEAKDGAEAVAALAREPF